MRGLTEGTAIISSSAADGIGIIVRSNRRNRADGYDVLDGGMYTRFVPDWCAQPAVVRGTVCDKPRFECYCGLTHTTAEQLAKLPWAEL